MGRKKKIRRFPRIYLPKHLKHHVRILRLTYNDLAKRRNPRLKYWIGNWDIFSTKRGDCCKIDFVKLAGILKDQNIDPSLYLKIMARYGRYKDAPWMPKTSWLAKDSTVEKFHWLYRKERKTYDLHLQFKKDISGWSDLDIYAAIRDSSKMFTDATEQLGLHEDEASILLKKDLSPWYKAMRCMEDGKEGKDFRLCLDLLRRNKHIRRLARKAYRRRDGQ